METAFKALIFKGLGVIELASINKKYYNIVAYITK